MYIFVAVPCERERFAPIGTGFPGERDLYEYMFVPASREREMLLYILVPPYCGREMCMPTILCGTTRPPQPTTPPAMYILTAMGGGVVLIYFMLICSGAERGENGSECRECAKEKEQEIESSKRPSRELRERERVLSGLAGN